MNILIIGATSGIGKELLNQYIAQGHSVIACGRRENILNELSKQNSSVKEVQLDICDIDSTTPTIHGLFAQMKIDIAIVTAGIGDLNPTLDNTIELNTLQTNVTAWTNCVDLLYKAFQKQGFGHLVLITSVGGLRGEPAAPAYSASKAYQMNYAEALKKKAFKNLPSLRITEVRPGLVDTAMAKGDGLFWVMPTNVVVKQILRAINKKQATCIVTKRWRIVHFIMRHLPWGIYKRI
ncbi:MAG: SDR family NAD(P)-dependent oxidoreductase [Paludibacteraceae bacterium]|nr:SDR family NAD(P)-dependent oxidoreductase [Paludibacteraceae bacterium]